MYTLIVAVMLVTGQFVYSEIPTESFEVCEFQKQQIAEQLVASNDVEDYAIQCVARVD